jgi:hypothetical protein
MGFVYAIALLLLLAFTAHSVRVGTWSGTWCASGRRDDRSQFPGPYADAPRRR